MIRGCVYRYCNVWAYASILLKLNLSANRQKLRNIQTRMISNRPVLIQRFLFFCSLDIFRLSISKSNFIFCTPSFFSSINIYRKRRDFVAEKSCFFKKETAHSVPFPSNDLYLFYRFNLRLYQSAVCALFEALIQYKRPH